MTLPRRLTPSATERSTVVQQRMAPGGALGVGSRHVRTSQRPASGSSGGGGGSVVASYDLFDNNVSQPCTGGGYRAVFAEGNFSTGDVGSYFSLVGSGSSRVLRLTEPGWFALSTTGWFGSLTGSDGAQIEAVSAFPPVIIGYGPGAFGNVFPVAASVPFYMSQADIDDDADFWVVCKATGSAGVVSDIGLTAVRFA